VHAGGPGEDQVTSTLNQSDLASAGSENGAAPAKPPIFAALDLGTNNCRLLIARLDNGNLKVIDAFSRIVRLGEGMAKTGELSSAAIERTIEALRICNNKIKWHSAVNVRLVATEACRSAANGQAFVGRVAEELNLALEIIDRATEARLAAAGADPLIDENSGYALVFDIGGGSTEIMLIERRNGKSELGQWSSLPVGVVTLSERFGGRDVSAQVYEAMREYVRAMLQPFQTQITQSFGGLPPLQLLGTSGTVTTVAGVHLGLRYYDRNVVDGCWLTMDEVARAVAKLQQMTFDERVRFGCIGKERADLVLAGCAILDEVIEAFPGERIRVADRGVREGILAELLRDHKAAEVQA
jgi:exopolyphosphatase / guanosine-5'-triphosphate,3'-diphosphate pyrophosphatase